MKLVFATNNRYKILEVQDLVKGQINILSLNQINCFDEIVENRNTIEGNAKVKAEFIRKNYNLDSFADDTGLEVFCLDGKPGVNSKRFSGINYSISKNIEKLLIMMKGKSNREAQFKTVIALNVKNKVFTFTGICKGKIIHQRKGEKGFGYDSVFVPKGHNITFAEMDLKLKNSVGHRSIAINKLISHLKSL